MITKSKKNLLIITNFAYRL